MKFWRFEPFPQAYWVHLCLIFFVHIYYNYFDCVGLVGNGEAVIVRGGAMADPGWGIWGK